MGRALLTEQELVVALGSLPEWKHSGQAIHRTFSFADFIEAFAFMAQCALVAEKMDHHPDWRNVYRTVEVELSTHDAGGITALDVALANKIDSIAARF